MTLSEFKHELRLNLKSDPWGEAMSAFFEAASHLYARGENIPHVWGYSPGMCEDPRDEENYWYELFAQCSDNELQTIGAFLNRLCDALRRADKSY